MALQIFILLIVVLVCSASADSTHNLPTRCPQAERLALRDLKDGALDPAGKLSSWSGADCCQWGGIHCDNQTGHVIGIHLRNPHFDYDGHVDSSWALQFGKLLSSLLALNRLSYLDLSANNFKDTVIPQFLGSFRELTYLNLSLTNLKGTIPRQLGRLSNLRTLSLRVHGEYSNTSLVLDNPRWLSDLRSLRNLEIGFTVLASGWLQSLNMLPSLRLICVLDSIIDDKDTLSLPHLNFTSLEILNLSSNYGLTSALFSWVRNLTRLEYLDLSANGIAGTIPEAAWNLHRLQHLYLSDNEIAQTIPEAAGNLHMLQYLDLSLNSFSGVIPVSIGNLTQLRGLYLYDNNLNGQIPDSIGILNQLQELGLSGNMLTGSLPGSIGQLSQLESLDLFSNMLTGMIPETLGQLSQLVNLDLSNNSFDGIVTKSHFASLLKLKELRLSDNPMLTIKISSGWRLPSDLYKLRLRGCQVGPKFPSWIRTQRNMTILDLSSTNISDSIPDWFWSRHRMQDLNLSYNKIHGRVPSSLQFSSSPGWIDLHSNLFDGPLPNDIKNLTILDFSDNRFTGIIPQGILVNTQGRSTSLFLSKNSLTGQIPASLCDVDLEVLDLSGNHITGQLPNCSLCKYMFSLDLSNNRLTGRIPDFFLNSSDLEYLYLSNNSFTGEVPSTLAQSNNLIILDLSNNRFEGELPIWLDDSFRKLRILRLSSNMLTGFLPAKTLSRVPNIQILDLSHNNLSGTIPESFGDFTSMMRQNEDYYQDLPTSDGYYIYYDDSMSNIRVSLDIKGRNFEYGGLLKFLTSIDLSSNNLSGVIPKELGNLTWLQNLNLSGNHLTGDITEVFGGMHHLESLDLSRNDLSGLLPQTLASLNFLETLNVSYNNFSGRIPSGGQLDTFNDPSIYMGNPYLNTIGPTDKTHTNQTDRRENKEVDDDEDEMVWFFIGLAPGLVVGFWALFGFLVFKKTWRHAYFRAIDNVYDLLYIKVVVHYRKFNRSFQSRT